VLRSRNFGHPCCDPCIEKLWILIVRTMAEVFRLDVSSWVDKFQSIRAPFRVIQRIQPALEHKNGKSVGSLVQQLIERPLRWQDKS
jgi:hypothetical protein